MIREFLYREDEVCLLVRREDSFPVATVGNTEGLFGITDEAFSRDDTELFRAMKEPEKGYAFFRKYGVWDGKTLLSAEIEMKNGKMTTIPIPKERIPTVMSILPIREIRDLFSRKPPS